MNFFGNFSICFQIGGLDYLFSILTFASIVLGTGGVYKKTIHEVRRGGGLKEEKTISFHEKRTLMFGGIFLFQELDQIMFQLRGFLIFLGRDGK